MMNREPRLHRRSFLLGAAALGAGAASSLGVGRDLAHAAGPPRRRLATKERRVGALEVVALVDATGPFFLDRQSAFPSATGQDWEAASGVDPGAFGPDGTWVLDFRCFAIRGPGGRVALVDTGVGPAGSPAAAWAPVPGRLPQELVAAGIDAEDVDVVVLTHLHEDHYGWSVQPDGTPAFRNATYYLQRGDVEALSDEDVASTYVVQPLRSAGLLRLVDGQLRLPPRGRTTTDTVTLLPTPGHTPGHQSVLVEGDSQQIVVTGDVLVHAVQIVNPDVAYRYERDQARARDTRTTLLADARARHAVLATAHLTRPFVDA